MRFRDMAHFRFNRACEHSSNNFRHQIVIVCFGDLAAIELARFRIDIVGKVVDEDLPVNFRRMHCRTAFQQQFGFFRFPFQQQIEFLPTSAFFFVC